jgi:hypothetical protein
MCCVQRAGLPTKFRENGTKAKLLDTIKRKFRGGIASLQGTGKNLHGLLEHV